MRAFAESEVEAAALSWLEDIGWQVLPGPDLGPEAAEGARERASYAEMLLLGRLRGALVRLNPTAPAAAIEAAVARILATETPSLILENRRLHGFLANGVAVEVVRDDGSVGGALLRLLDIETPERNDFLAVNQFAVVESGHSRRPDIILFVNGLPLVVIELKNPSVEAATLLDAFHQLQTYKAQIPSLFRTNGLLVISDGLTARAGSLTGDLERYMPWRTVDGETIAPKGTPELRTLLVGMFAPERLVELLAGYMVFQDEGDGPVKKIAGYHQLHAVRRAVTCTVAASRPSGDRRVGVVWHTQGSGKSLLMAFYAGRIILHPSMGNPTLVVLTDRNDLDEQLFGTFASCGGLLRQTPVRAETREALRDLLSVASGGVVFTTIQKFAPLPGEDRLPVLTDRRNVVVIADEAHRSQYGFGAKVDRGTGQVGYGFAKHLRDALPGASFIGFTGTPIEAGDKNTPAVFGDYIDVYDIHRAVEDGATVPIYYESRLARIELDEAERPRIDAEVEEITEQEDTVSAERMKSRWARVEALVGAERRLRQIAQDIVTHFEARLAGLDGKAMVVCMSRRICVALHEEILRLRPAWFATEDDQGAVKVIMTGSASDRPDWQQHIRTKDRREAIGKRLRRPDDPLRMVIVRDMWLTGFDAPCLHTLYVDKPMRGHGLMQAIARVNRVFRDKPGGLVVDYIGLAENLKQALRDYSDDNRAETGIAEEDAVAALGEAYEVIAAMFHGFDWKGPLVRGPTDRLTALAGAVEWVLDMQRRDGAAAADETARKRVRRRFGDAVTALSRAFALASASDRAREIRDEVGFFQAVQAFLATSGAGTAQAVWENDLAVQQLINRAVVSTEIVDVLAAAGVASQDISVLSDEFLAEIRGMDRRNLALEALRKLLAGEISSRQRENVVQSRRFTERLEDAIRRYHNNAISTAQVLEELIGLAKELQAARKRGEERGLTQEELAFYDALAANDSAVEAMGDAQLRVIAHELLTQVKGSVTVDWAKRESARARLRVLVKRILRKHGYPPDMQESAVRTVLEQAEVLSALWTA